MTPPGRTGLPPEIVKDLAELRTVIRIALSRRRVPRTEWPDIEQSLLLDLHRAFLEDRIRAPPEGCLMRACTSWCYVASWRAATRFRSAEQPQPIDEEAHAGPDPIGQVEARDALYRLLQDPARADQLFENLMGNRPPMPVSSFYARRDRLRKKLT